MSNAEPTAPDHRTMVKTATPGIFKRGKRYVFSYRVDGKQKWESARTLAAARKAKSERTTDIERGEYDEASDVTLHQYAREWVKRYQGRGRRGFRENTRDEYKRVLDQHVLAYFSKTVKLTDLRPTTIAKFVGHLCQQTTPAPTKDDADRRVLLSDSTVRNIMAPLRSCLASAVREGIIRSNPAREIDMPHRESAEESEDEEVRAMTRDELATLLALIPERWRLFFTALAGTGLRVSEALALQWRHLQLDGSKPHVKVRRALVRGRMGPPKSKYGKREVPLDAELVSALRERRKGSEWPGEKDLVFPAGNGAVMSQGNLRRRVLKPAREEACMEWVGFHAFRHTCATLLFADGRNVKQVQRWLGHHSAAFTLATYVHLLDGDIGEPLSLVQGVNKVRTDPTPEHTTTPEQELANMAQESQSTDSAPSHSVHDAGS